MTEFSNQERKERAAMMNELALDFMQRLGNERMRHEHQEQLLRFQNSRLVEMARQDPQRDPYAARKAVGEWLRTRAEDPALEDTEGFPGTRRQVLTQLAADADHSDLLIRLFKGEEPLPYEEWKASRA